MLLKRCTITLFRVRTWWISYLLLVPALLCSQSRLDSSYSPYDSIQDLLLKQMEAQWQNQLRQTDKALKEWVMLTDSLSGIVSGLNDRMGPLETENYQLKERIAAIQNQLDQRSKETETYQRKLRMVLWIGGTTLLLLLLASFLFLLFYSLHTRRLLQSVRIRLKRLRRAVRGLQEDLSKIPVVKKKRIRKIAASEVKSRLRRIKFRKK